MAAWLHLCTTDVVVFGTQVTAVAHSQCELFLSVAIELSFSSGLAVPMYTFNVL